MQAITYPSLAVDDNIEGEVVVEFTVTANDEIKDAVIKSSTNRVFNRASLNAVQEKLKCQGSDRDTRVQLPLNFKLQCHQCAAPH